MSWIVQAYEACKWSTLSQWDSNNKWSELLFTTEAAANEAMAMYALEAEIPYRIKEML